MTAYPRPGFTTLVYNREGYVWVCGDTERLDVWRDSSVSLEDDPLLAPVRVFVEAHGLTDMSSEISEVESWSGWHWLSSSAEHLVYAHSGSVPPGRDPRELITAADDLRAVDYMCESVKKPQGVQRWQVDE